MTYSHLDTYEWTGDFWEEGREKDKFSGTLSYSPSKGIILTTLQYRTFDDSEDSTPKTIHGYTHETGRVTLVQSISTGRASIKENSINLSYFCSQLIIGDHFSTNDYFSSISVNFSNLNEFCYPQGFKAEDEYNQSNILDSKILDDEKIFSISLNQNAIGTFSIPTLSRLFLLDEKESETKEAMNREFKELLEKYELNRTVLKKEITYVFGISKSEESIKEICFLEYMKILYSIMLLLSFLMLKPIKPLIIKTFDKKAKKSCEVLSTILISDSEIEALKNDKSHHMLPLNLKDIRNNFGVTFPMWHKLFSENYNIRISTITNHILSKVDSIQHFILLLTSLEQVSMDGNKNYKKSEKYSWAINKYASEDIIEQLKIFSPEGVSIDEHISNLRTCIIHPKSLESKKYVKYKDKISNQSISNISEMLFIILLHSLYDAIKLEDPAIKKFMDRHRFYTRVYYDY